MDRTLYSKIPDTQEWQDLLQTLREQQSTPGVDRARKMLYKAGNTKYVFNVYFTRKPCNGPLCQTVFHSVLVDMIQAEYQRRNTDELGGMTQLRRLLDLYVAYCNDTITWEDFRSQSKAVIPNIRHRRVMKTLSVTLAMRSVLVALGMLAD